MDAPCRGAGAMRLAQRSVAFVCGRRQGHRPTRYETATKNPARIRPGANREFQFPESSDCISCQPPKPRALAHPSP